MKKVLSLMMTLVMMFGLVTVVATEAHAAEHTHCICGDKAKGVGDHKTCANVTYTELTADVAASALQTGNYYLGADLQLSGQMTIAENAVVNICLNGYKLKGSGDNKSAIMVNKNGLKLSICDCKGTGVIEGNSAKAGSSLYLNGDKVVVNLFGGTVAYNTVACGSTVQGANVVVNNNGLVFNMYGGTIKDGKTTGALAGNVQVKKGAMNMYGGTIKDGVAAGNGGNIEVRDGVLTIYNGTITGGKLTASEVTDGADNADIFVNSQGDDFLRGSLVIYNLQESVYVRFNSKTVDNADFSKMDSSLSLSAPLKVSNPDGTTTRANTLLVKTKTSGTPATGDMTSPVMVVLCMVAAAAGMVYFVPKKRRA